MRMELCEWMRRRFRIWCAGAFLAVSLAANATDGDSVRVYGNMTVSQNLDLNEEKPKFVPRSISTFLTMNVEQLSYYQSGKFFQPQNMAFGLKVGTMRYSGWYLSAMSNFNFKGTFKLAEPALIVPSSKTHSYFEALFGLTGRYYRSTSFHFGVGYFHKTSNYRMQNGAWGHIRSETALGPVAAMGFMFHIHSFVFSVEGVVNYNVHAPEIRQGFGYGAKLGLGFCFESKKNRKGNPYEDDDQVLEMPRDRTEYVPLTDKPVSVEGQTSQPTLTKQELDSLSRVLRLPKPSASEKPAYGVGSSGSSEETPMRMGTDPAADPAGSSPKPKRSVTD